ncbi:MAG TPA: molybdopterin-binding protein [Roseiflexaceae bacterium]|nr:molybdopterin-binding protein [Roseiflexaceae bacterium]
MYQTIVSPEEAIGHILRHNLTDAHGHKALAKGHKLVAEDLEKLRSMGLQSVPVAVLEPGDVHENEAARRLAEVVGGAGVRMSKPAGGRVNLLAEADGVAQIDAEALLRINEHDGMTVATVPTNTLVRARKRVATIKIIPFAVPEGALAEAEAAARGGGAVVSLRPLRSLNVGVIMVGSAAARERIEHSVFPAVEGRVDDLGSTVGMTRYVPPDEGPVAEAICELAQASAQLIIIVGETSIMDRDDVTPRGVRRAGGRIEHYGAPVEPGNLLLIAYLNEGMDAPLPVVGAPGCVRSRDTNIVDLVLPRLLAGEQITKRDIVALGHGGLLD